jgi:hypothetical protein
MGGVVSGAGSATAARVVRLEVSRRRLVGAELADPVNVMMLVPTLLLAALFVAAGSWVMWIGLATIAGLSALAHARTFLVWLRRIPAIVVDADAIDLQGSGPIPWDAIRNVVVDSRRVFVELREEARTFGVDEPCPPWFSAAHDDLMGDGRSNGGINVPVRWIDASADEIAAVLRPFAPVPVDLATQASAP